MREQTVMIVPSESDVLLAQFRTDFEEMKVETNCLCGGNRGISIMKRDRYGIGIVPFFCTHCGHVYSKFRLKESDLERFYATTAYRMLYSKAVHLTPTEKGREKTRIKVEKSREVILPVFQSLFRDPRGKVVFEWGCSAGWNLVPFKEANITAFGFDVDREYVEYGRAHFGLNLYTLEDSEDPRTAVGCKADFVILNHVLEHVSQPMEVLKRASGFLKDGGLIFVGLPFLEHLPEWGFKGFFHIGHLHYFSIPYFMSLVQRNGFRVVQENRRQGYVLLQATGKSVPRTPTFRFYNGAVLLRYALAYVLATLPWKVFLNGIRKVPWLARLLQGFRRAILQPQRS